MNAIIEKVTFLENAGYFSSEKEKFDYIEEMLINAGFLE
jgi:hypothetical protein